MKEKIIKEEWISLANEIHGKKYNYFNLDLKNRTNGKIIINCPIHGDFSMKPSNHIHNKQGCPKCGKISYINTVSLTNDEFILKAKKTHGDKYDYSMVKYVNMLTKVYIVCKEHGGFWQTPGNHLKGKGCRKCKYEKMSILQTMSINDFIKKAENIHYNTYDYSKVNYKNAHTKVCIICPTHGEFYQLPNAHLSGKGCKRCGNKSKLESKVINMLISNNIEFEHEKSFPWLKYSGSMRLDFYLPKLNIAIECQGKQHFEPVDFAGRGKSWAYSQFIETINKDNEKYILCRDNNIRLLYLFEYKYNNEFYNDKVFLHNENRLKKMLM